MLTITFALTIIMGNKLTCPCGRTDIEGLESTQNNKQVHDIVDQLMIGKLPPQSIIYEFSYEITKLYLINSSQIEEFCNNRNLFKFSKKSRDIYSYYNIFFVTNFLTKKDTAMVLLQYIQPKPVKENICSYHPKGSRFDLISGIFKVEDFKYSYQDILDIPKLTDSLIKVINAKVLKNFMFVGLLSTEESIFKLIFQRNMLKDNDFLYNVNIFEGIISEDDIKKILQDEKNKFKLLKASFVVKMSKSSKKYLFFFEENVSEPVEYDHLVVSLERGASSKEDHVKDLVSKLNDLQDDYKLATIVSEDKIIYIVLSNSLKSNTASEIDKF